MFLHELSHIFRDSVFSNDWPGWFDEAYVTMVSIYVFEEMWGKNFGLYTKSGVSHNFFRYITGNNDVGEYWRILFVFFYLSQKYRTTINREFLQLWANETSNDAKERILDAGFNENETFCIVYSYLAGENLAWLFSLAGIQVSHERVVQALSMMNTCELYLITIDDHEFHISTVCNSLISSLGFNEKKGITFDVSGVSGTIGHCNITIPREILDGHFSIMIDGIPVSYAFWQNTTHNSIYFVYDQSAHRVQVFATYIIPEFPSFLILPLLMTATLLVTIVLKRKLPLNKKPLT
jgi:hypothetical protein